MFTINEKLFTEITTKVAALADRAFSVSQNDFPIEGVANYVRVSCSNESDLDIFFVILDDGTKLSIFDYGINSVRWDDGKAVSFASINANHVSPYDFYLNVHEFNECVNENPNYKNENGPAIVALLTELLA